jgi:hypothetical protein
MNCLTTAEQSDWLARLKIVEKPYRNSQAPRHYTQFYAPKSLRAVQAFALDLLLTFFESGDALLTITDWSSYESYEMRLFDSLRSIDGETRSLIEAPGHLCGTTEKDDLVGLFSLSVAFEWTAYLYLPDAKVTVLNWEGAIFDFWAEDADGLERMAKSLSTFSLPYTDTSHPQKPS